MKRSGFAVQTWKVRWVELDLMSGCLFYFEHSRCSVNGDKPTGKIDLRARGRSRMKRIKSLSDCHGMAFAFELINDKENLFSSVSFEERKIWLDAITRIVAEDVKGPHTLHASRFLSLFFLFSLVSSFVLFPPSFALCSC